LKLGSWKAGRLGVSIIAVDLPASQLSLSPKSQSSDCESSFPDELKIAQAFIYVSNLINYFMIFEASWVERIDGLKVPAGFSSSHPLILPSSQLLGLPTSWLPGFPASWPPSFPAVKAYYF
jgi:hypothetical protein